MKAGIFSLLLYLLMCVPLAAQSKSGIEGVWRLTEVTKSGTNASTNKSPQPGLYLFAKKHYSIMYVSSDAARPDIADIGKSTADELRNVFVDSFVANSGTYELKGGKLTVHPMVAKSPSYMAANSVSVSSVKIDGNMMTLVSESTNATPTANPTTYKLTRVE